MGLAPVADDGNWRPPAQFAGAFGMNVMGLVQLCEAAQPAGGYGHSLGIEGMVRGGRLRSPDELESVVTRLLDDAIGPADGIASGIAFRAARGGAFERISEVCAVMSSPRLPPSMQLASLQMGQRLWIMSRGWQWAASVHEQLDELAGANDLHHAVAFGLLVSETTSSQLRAIATYLYNAAKNMVLGAAREIPLEETTGMRVLSSMQSRIAELAAKYADKDTGDIAVK
jgi:urease accessory protein